MSSQAQAVLQAQQKTAVISPNRGNILQRAAVVPEITPVHSGILQRCSGGVECEECRQKRLEREGMLQRAAVNAAPVHVNKNGSGVPPIVHEVLGSLGQALDAGTRAFMEPRFGYDFSHVQVHSNAPQIAYTTLTVNQPGDQYEQEANQIADTVMGAPVAATTSRQGYSRQDFSQVRIHTDARAAESAQAVNARAYTVGHNIVFGAGQYAPTTSEGKRLLAHELTHVIQQQSSGLLRTFIQRTVAAANVDCVPPAAVDVPIVGTNPLSTLRTADSEAIELLTNALDELKTTRGHILAGEPAAWPTISDHTARGLQGIFRMNPDDPTIWTGTGEQTVHILIRRLEIVRNLLLSGLIHYHCRSSTVGDCSASCGGITCCTPGDQAASCEGIFDNFLCDAFWGQGAAGRTYSVMHEPFHMSFGFIGDVGRFTNAHCYSRLAFWLKGRDAPANRHGRCPLAP